jgi:hypothetical protein
MLPSGAAESNGSDCWAIVRHPNHARLAQLDRNTVDFIKVIVGSAAWPLAARARQAGRA